MQSLPNELIVEISKTLPLEDIQNLASTCKIYRDLLYEDIQKLKEMIMKDLKKNYIRITVAKDWNLLYKFCIYNTKRIVRKVCKKRGCFGGKIYEHLINTKPYIIMKRYMFIPDLYKNIVAEKKMVDFQFLLDTVINSYIHNLDEVNEEEMFENDNELFNVNEYYSMADSVNHFYEKGEDIDEVIYALKDVVNYPKSYTNCNVKYVFKTIFI
jgi:hypothetical protein